MSKKWLFTLFAWYIAWSVVASVFSKKKWTEVQKQLEKVKGSKEDTFKILLNNFIDTHKNLLDSVKEEVLTEENKALFNEKKDQLVTLIDDYKKEGEKLLSELKNEWWDVVKVGKQKIKALYEEKKDKIDELIWDAPEIADELKSKLVESFEDFKNKLKEK